MGAARRLTALLPAALFGVALAAAAPGLHAQVGPPALVPSFHVPTGGDASHSANESRPAARVARFLAGRQAEAAAAAQGVSAAEAWQAARSVQAEIALHPRSGGFTAAWQPLGPVAVTSPVFGALTGRVTAIAPDPNDTTGNTVYVGTTGGGVWKSTTAAGVLSAAKFAPLTDTLSVFSTTSSSYVVPSLSIGALAVQPAATAVVLAGTGDPNDASDSLYGEGLLRSADGGVTWTLVNRSNDGVNGIHTFAGLGVAGLAWSTASPSLVVAAFSTSAEAAVVGATPGTSLPGLYYSTDAGQSWQMASVYDGSQVVQAPQPLGGSGNAATSVVWDARRGSFYAALRGHGFYASTDGITWTRLSHQPGTALTLAKCPTIGGSNCPLFRGTLAVQPTTGDLYALSVDGANHDQGLWQDLCQASSSGACSTAAPVFANRIDGGALEVGQGDTTILQGAYNLALTALPASAGGTLLLAGTVDVFRCSLSAGASSCTWRNTTNALNGCSTPAGVAPAQHALAGLATSNGVLVFIGNDSGLWRSTDGIAQTGAACTASDATHFDSLNTALAAGGSLAEIVGFAQSPADPGTLLAGLGENGTAGTEAAAQLNAWPQLSAGEGGYPSIDQVTTSNWYAAIGAGVNLRQCTLGANCTASSFAPPSTIGGPQVSNDNALLDAPTLLDPAAQTSVLAATCRVWRGPAGNSSGWTSANAISAPFDGGSAPCSATSALARSLAAGGTAAGSGNTQNAGSEVIYAGMAGVLDGGGTSLGGHVFRTEAGNAATSATTWTDIAKSPVTNDTSHSGLFNPYGLDVSAVVVDPHDATGATVYATLMGFGANGAFSPHVYRSTDFGAHWLTITANLPAVPANALVVDPNDANTVYVATDSGVFATQAVTTCPTANCWTMLGTGLPNAPVTSLAAGGKLPTGSGTLGMLRAGTYGRGLWQIPLLAAVSIQQPAMALAPSSLTFTAQSVSSTSTAQTLTLTSNGNAPLTISSVAITGDYNETDTCAGKTLAVNATCTLSVVFAPTQTGTRAGVLTVYGNVSGGQASATLSGTGAAAAAIALTPSSLTFASTTVNQTSAAQIITVANTGGTAATLQTPALTGDFALSANTCGATLAASTACSLAITFTPTVAGTRNGTLSIATSAGTQTAVLSGTGAAPATDTLSPAALNFGQQTIGSTGSPLQVTLTNAGDASLTLIAASTGSSEFPLTSTCGATLAGHASCVFSITFAPSATGARSATLTVNDAYRTQTVALSGTGVAAPGVSLTPASLSFPDTGVGLSAPAQTLTLTNNGGSDLTLSNTALSGDFLLAATSCGSTLTVGSACTFTIVFSPKAGGARSGALTLTDNAASTTQTVALSGNGIDFSLAANGAATATIGGTSGSATFPLLLSSNAGIAGAVALSCSGAPAHATCTVTPATASLGSQVNVSAVVETGVATAALAPSRHGVPWMLERTPLLALVLPLLAWGRGRRLRALALIAACGMALGVVSGCGANRTVPGNTGTAPASTPTPPGSYNLTVTATAAGVSRSVGLTLIVQ